MMNWFMQISQCVFVPLEEFILFSFFTLNIMVPDKHLFDFLIEDSLILLQFFKTFSSVPLIVLELKPLSFFYWYKKNNFFSSSFFYLPIFISTFWMIHHTLNNNFSPIVVITYLHPLFPNFLCTKEFLYILC